MPDIEMCLSTSCPSSRQCLRHKDSGTVPGPMQAYGYHEPDWGGRCPFYLSKPEALFQGHTEIFAGHAAEARRLRRQMKGASDG